VSGFFFGGAAGGPAGAGGGALLGTALGTYRQLFQSYDQQTKNLQPVRNAILCHFGYDEGLYLDSKTMSFEAAWFLTTPFSLIFFGTGTWYWTPEVGGQAWAQSIQDIVGWKSWLANQLDPTGDVIVDMGGGMPPAPPIK